jgi:hypothetical protein
MGDDGNGRKFKYSYYERLYKCVGGAARTWRARAESVLLVLAAFALRRRRICTDARTRIFVPSDVTPF